MNYCYLCDFSKMPADGGHCYMFEIEPSGHCYQYRHARTSRDQPETLVGEPDPRLTGQSADNDAPFQE